MLSWQIHGTHDLFRREGCAIESYKKYIVVIGGQGEEDIPLGEWHGWFRFSFRDSTYALESTSVECLFTTFFLYSD